MAEFHIDQCHLMPYLRIIVDDDPSQSGPGPMNLVDMGLSQAIVGWATRSMLSTVSTKGMQKVSARYQQILICSIHTPYNFMG